MKSVRLFSDLVNAASAFTSGFQAQSVARETWQPSTAACVAPFLRVLGIDITFQSRRSRRKQDHQDACTLEHTVRTVSTVRDPGPRVRAPATAIGPRRLRGQPSSRFGGLLARRAGPHRNDRRCWRCWRKRRPSGRHRRRLRSRPMRAPARSYAGLVWMMS